jgi:hypothetical protein
MLGNDKSIVFAHYKYILFDYAWKEIHAFSDNSIKMISLDGASHKWKSKNLKFFFFMDINLYF